MKIDNPFKKPTKTYNNIVIGEPYDVKHVYHIGIDSSSDNTQTFWNTEKKKQSTTK